MRLVCLIFFVFSFAVAICGQDYNYQQYDLKDGLSGLTVYSIVQDKDGFLWFGTETGLSRFDGTNFKNFTTANGLPDNEVLKLFVDSKNRIWILPFAHSICYYFNGNIYTQQNDSLLSKVKLPSEPVDINEDKDGNIAIIENGAIHLIEENCAVSSITTIRGLSFLTMNIGINENGNFLLPIVNIAKIALVFTI